MVDPLIPSMAGQQLSSRKTASASRFGECGTREHRQLGLEILFPTGIFSYQTCDKCAPKDHPRIQVTYHAGPSTGGSTEDSLAGGNLDFALESRLAESGVRRSWSRCDPHHVLSFLYRWVPDRIWMDMGVS